MRRRSGPGAGHERGEQMEKVQQHKQLGGDEEKARKNREDEKETMGAGQEGETPVVDGRGVYSLVVGEGGEGLGFGFGGGKRAKSSAKLEEERVEEPAETAGGLARGSLGGG